MAGILDSFGFLRNFKSGAVSLTSYAWVLYVFVGLALIIFSVYLWKIMRDKKKQWTHTLKVRRVLTNGTLSKEVGIKMRRFPLVKNANVFELENAVLGSYLIPELDSYTGTNEFSIIIDKNNRIYINTGESFNPESSSIMVSAKHAGIDLAFDDLKNDWQNIHKTSKRVEWSQIAKFALWGILIIAVMIVAIKGIGQWGENHVIDSQKAQAEAQAFQSLAEAMETSQATTNALVILADKIKEMEGSENLQTIVRQRVNNETI